ncbi:hypothetical protein ABH892_000279 [Paenibacillus sp. RC254]
MSEIGRLSRPNPTANLVSVQGEATNRRVQPWFILSWLRKKPEESLFPLASFCCLFIPGEELLMEGRLIIVTAPNETGRNFVKLLMFKKLAFAVLTNSAQEERQLKKMGVEHIVRINTMQAGKWNFPKKEIGCVYLFENSLNLTCRFLQICRPLTSDSIYVITHGCNPQGIYRGLGADHVIYTLNGEVGFLLNG